MRLSSILAALFLFSAAALPGASVPRMSFEQVVRSSPRAVHGVVVRTWSAWDASRTAIWTHYEVRVSETLRGPAEGTFTISEPGGAVGDLAMRVPGAPRLSVGQQAVLFAYPTPIGYWRISGWGQGLFPVNGSSVKPARLEGVTLLNTAGAAPKPEPESLDAFLGRVRSIVRAEEGR
jgi:hypothetical protein